MTEEQLKIEIDHIFESGANEIRIAELCKLYAARTEETAWVSVDERLPEIGQKVLAFRDGRDRDFPPFKDPAPSVYSGRFEVYKDVCIGDRVLVSYYGGITHWRPLPKPPKQ